MQWDLPLKSVLLSLCPVSKVAPTSAGKVPSYPPAHPPLSAQLVLALVARMLTGSGPGPPSQGHSCTLSPLSPALSRSSAAPCPPHRLLAPGGCPWCHRTGVLGRQPVSGSARAPAGQWPQKAAQKGGGVRAQGSKVGWPQQAWGGVLTLELGVEETLLRSTSLKAPSDWSDIWGEGGQEETMVWGSPAKAGEGSAESTSDFPWQTHPREARRGCSKGSE